ncbi:HlyD family efflux transporter periplasmic adaptor subunit [Thermosediminibacter litoriperuensis]|uniref:Putative membrane fusion protein n=1 Tax=Thermosediminibacter litoriperuensis TaxID=291989 RepID=A0A5S5ATR1_9FIRM|nr:HlyD family efflux transporter periplasmic adaptor subunit [Thermosediminibacter litoriperuensis]TYP54908.1 putative membrane fusion protein [Thermosediminibacter litoriperuensis]
MKKRTGAKVINLRPKKKRQKRRIFLPLLLGLFLFLILFLRSSARDIYIAREETVEDFFTSEAVIVKNEKVINSPAGGRLEVLVKAGERVRVNSPLFKVVTDVERKMSLDKDIGELEEKLNRLKEQSGSTLTIQILDKSIDDIERKIREARSKGQADRVAALEKELLRLEGEKKEIIAENNEAVQILEKSLESQKKKLEEVEPVVLSPVAGIVSFNIDGYEDLLRSERLKCLDYEEIKGVVPRQESAALSDNVKVNQAVLKIVDNFSLYVIAQIPEGNFQPGRKYDLRFPQLNIEVKADLIEICEDEQTGVFSIKEAPVELLELRKVNVEIVVLVHRGIGVPNSAVVNSNGQEGVFLFNKGELVFKPIRVVARDDNKTIVEGLKAGDRVLIKRGFQWRLFSRT